MRPFFVTSLQRIISVIIELVPDEVRMTWWPRHDNTQVRTLNNIIKIKVKIRTLYYKIEFLKEYFALRIVPKFIAFCITRSRAKTSVRDENTFFLDERHFKITKLASLRHHYCQLWCEKVIFLSLFDTIRFCRYLFAVDKKTDKVIQSKHNIVPAWLISKCYGFSFDLKVNNLLNYILNDSEKFVSKHGLKFCVSPKLNRECSLSEPTSTDVLMAFKVRVVDLVNMYCGSNIDKSNFYSHREHMNALNPLCNNNSIILSKTDKGGVVVILDKQDYN